MSRRGGRAYDRVRGLLVLVSLVGFVLVVVLFAGVAKAGDVSSADARGELGMGAPQVEAPPSSAASAPSEDSGAIPWMETSLYLLAASLVFAGYFLAQRRWPWLRRRRKP